ncbi:MAG: cytochrome c maturation protein CcmE [Gammaproteobacteria bacterium]|nr:cytochrome c maturation protein CcmE [Gammaproteobacteria bacterium]MDH5487327.1 cytochrome c maturation protein CcmE [Gammaproteobacteria bacterium]
MKTRHKRLAIIVTGVLGLTVAVLLVLDAFQSNLVFFYSPTEVLEGKVKIAPGQTIRIGGLVETGSVKRSADGLKVDFVITDNNKKLPVHYQGLLPDLFREGQGVVAQGKVQEGNTFAASEVLAKHDEKYMPPEAAQALKGGTFEPGDTTKKP